MKPDPTTPPEQARTPDQTIGGCQQDAGSRFRVFATDHVFGLIKCCPCCDGTLTFRATGWDVEENGVLVATDGEMQCSKEPDIDTDEWGVWCWDHFDSDYGDRWHTRLENVLADLRRKVRFKDDSENA